LGYIKKIPRGWSARHDRMVRDLAETVCLHGYPDSPAAKSSDGPLSGADGSRPDRMTAISCVVDIDFYK
jgi:hypothetical protein